MSFNAFVVDFALSDLLIVSPSYFFICICLYNSVHPFLFNLCLHFIPGIFLINNSYIYIYLNPFWYFLFRYREIWLIWIYCKDKFWFCSHHLIFTIYYFFSFTFLHVLAHYIKLFASPVKFLFYPLTLTFKLMLFYDFLCP